MIITSEQIDGWRAAQAQAESEIKRQATLVAELTQLIAVAERVRAIATESELAPMLEASTDDPAPRLAARPLPPARSLPSPKADTPRQAPTRAADEAGLTTHQRKMLGLARGGAVPAEIAERMGIERQTVHATFSLLRKKGIDVPRFSTSGRKAGAAARSGPVPSPAVPEALAELTAVAGACAPPAGQTAAAGSAIDDVVTWLRDVANVAVKEGGKPGTFNIGYGTKLQPNQPVDAVVRYANGIRKQAGLKPFDMPAQP